MIIAVDSFTSWLLRIITFAKRYCSRISFHSADKKFDEASRVDVTVFALVSSPIPYDAFCNRYTLLHTFLRGWVWG